MKTKHTPGPWHVVQYACFNSIQSVPMYGEFDLLNSDDCEKAEANAQLASTAPELIEACIAFCEELEKNATYDKVGQSYYKAKAAIKKATS